MAWRKPKNLREWLGMLLRHKKKFFFPAILMMIGVVYASRFVPREYEAVAKFERKLDITMQDMGNDIASKQLDSQRRLLYQHLMGRNAIEQLINDLQLTRGMARTKEGELTKEGQLAKLDLINKLTKRIKVRFEVKQNNDEVVAVSYSDSDHDQAPKVANELVENYMNKSSRELHEVLKEAQAFFEKEVTRYATRKREFESKKLRFEMDHRGLLPDDPQSVQSQLVELRSRLNAISNQLRLSLARREADSAFVKNQPELLEFERIGSNPLLKDLRDKFARLEEELEGHRRLGRKDTHPLVVKLLERLEVVKAEITKTPEQVVIGKDIRPNTQRIEAERRIVETTKQIEEFERQRDELQGQVEHYEILNRNFFVVRHDYMQILGELKEAGSQLKFWDENKRKAKIAVTAEVSKRGVRQRIIQHAPALARPSKPTPVQIAIVALFLGFGTGALMILLAELLDNSFHTVDQAVEDLKLPVLGTVNEIVTPGKAFRRKIMGFGVYPAMGLAMVLVLAGVYGMVYLSLEQPHRYKDLMDKPGDFLREVLFDPDS